MEILIIITILNTIQLVTSTLVSLANKNKSKEITKLLLDYNTKQNELIKEFKEVSINENKKFN